MWNALRTDLTEFVNTVKGETAEALNQIDASFPESGKGEGEDEDAPTPAEEEALRRMSLEETFTTPLIPEKNDAASEDISENAAEEEGAKESAESTDDEIEDEEEEEEEVSEEVKEFVASFSIDSKTDEIALLLDLHPQTLKVQFETLVPTTVKYEDFWMRYFYRCDAARIQAEWDAEEEAAQEARKQAVQQGISTVRNLLGGAVKAVSSTLGEDSTGGSPRGGGLKMTANQAAKVASGYFGSAGRPPFVMNTAVSEDDDEAEEEEELGWDDEDEEEEYSDGGNEDANNEESVETEQIEFNDAVTEKLQDDLKQALAERDSLQQTVELQQKEIATLKQGATSNDDIEKLKTQLFEKDSEIAAMRASMLDSSRTDEGDVPDPKVVALEAEVQRLSTKLNETESSATKAADKLEKTQKALEEATAEAEKSKKAAEVTNGQNEQLTTEVADLKKKMHDLETDNSNFQQALKAAQEKVKQGQSSQAEATSLKAELEKVKAELASSKAELTKAKELLRLKDEASKEDEAKSVDSPDTVSTGIKIEPPSVEKLDEEGDAGDGWDDDW